MTKFFIPKSDLVCQNAYNLCTIATQLCVNINWRERERERERDRERERQETERTITR